MAERRQHLRYPVLIPVELRCSSEAAEPESGEWQTGIMMSGGPNGIFIKMDEPFPLGTRLEVKLPFKAGEKVVPVMVFWVSADIPKGLGARFMETSTDFQEQVLDEIEAGRWLMESLKEKKKKSESGFFSSDIADLLKDV